MGSFFVSTAESSTSPSPISLLPGFDEAGELLSLLTVGRRGPGKRGMAESFLALDVENERPFLSRRLLPSFERSLASREDHDARPDNGADVESGGDPCGDEGESNAKSSTALGGTSCSPSLPDMLQAHVHRVYRRRRCYLHVAT